MHKYTNIYPIIKTANTSTENFLKSMFDKNNRIPWMGCPLLVSLYMKYEENNIKTTGVNFFPPYSRDPFKVYLKGYLSIAF